MTQTNTRGNDKRHKRLQRDTQLLKETKTAGKRQIQPPPEPPMLLIVLSINPLTVSNGEM